MGKTIQFKDRLFDVEEAKNGTRYIEVLEDDSIFDNVSEITHFTEGKSINWKYIYTVDKYGSMYVKEKDKIVESHEEFLARIKSVNTDNPIEKNERKHRRLYFKSVKRERV